MDVFTLEFWHGVWTDFVEFFAEMPAYVVGELLGAIASAVESIQPPDFMASYQLGNVLGPAEPYIGYFLAQSGLAVGLSLIASATLFRTLRRLLTLGIW